MVNGELFFAFNRINLMLSFLRKALKVRGGINELLQEFINWISDYNNLILSVQVFVAGVTAFATVVLAFVTRALARCNQARTFCGLQYKIKSNSRDDGDRNCIIPYNQKHWQCDGF